MKNKEPIIIASVVAGFAVASGVFAAMAAGAEKFGNVAKDVVDKKLLDKTLKIPTEKTKLSWIIK
ncbi:MAG: hypothetical protein Q4E28_02635 [Clostridia bacterium]|nr:hypothetical protein [Clostridia bacterium]